MENKIGQISIRPSSRKDPCVICDKKRSQMLYYAKHVEDGSMEHVQRSKGRQILLQ